MTRVRWLAVLIPVILISSGLHAQKRGHIDSTDNPLYNNGGGNFSVGARNTFSVFSDGNPKAFGAGAGGHFRLQLIDRVNTEWFADVLSNNIDNKAHRMDYHVGWSVMYYLINTKGFTRKFTPYVVAGHCFDETVIKLNGENQQSKSRFSSALQAGMGCHYNITPKFDISLCTQYMIHLGKELDAVEGADGVMQIVEHKNAGWQGHLLISLSVNYKFLKLWKARK